MAGGVLQAPRGHCVVLGAGVVGLTTALVLVRQGWLVTVIAQAFPFAYDKHDPLYASPKAGAHWCSFADKDDLRLQRLELDTFKILMAMVDSDPDSPVMCAPSLLYYKRKPADWSEPWFARHVPDYHELDKSEIPPGYEFGISHTTVCMSVPQYLARLVDMLRSSGRAQFVQKHIGMTRTAVVVNCLGLGARDVGGVRDARMVPVRGQIAVVMGDGIGPSKTGFTYAAGVVDDGNGLTTAEATYVIPRKDGSCVLGGTFIVGDEDMDMRDETFMGFVARCASIDEQYQLPMYGRGGVISHSVGLRPAREGGRPCVCMRRCGGRTVVLAHNYGHGSYGFQTSWGSAIEAMRVVEGALLQVDLAGPRTAPSAASTPLSLCKT
ncbi:FAD dependent oxidoreductase, partial [Entophlyctis helioformis]